MYIPTNHERIQTISELVREELNEHEIRGGVYYDDAAEQIAARAIHSCMPGLIQMRQERIVVEAEMGISLKDSYAQTHDGLRVEARLERVAIQSLVQILDDSDSQYPLTYSTYDLFAVLRPRYVDPDPVDIVFGDEIYVPFEGVQLFEQIDA